MPRAAAEVGGDLLGVGSEPVDALAASVPLLGRLLAEERAWGSKSGE